MFRNSNSQSPTPVAGSSSASRLYTHLNDEENPVEDQRDDAVKPDQFAVLVAEFNDDFETLQKDVIDQVQNGPFSLFLQNPQLINILKNLDKNLITTEIHSHKFKTQIQLSEILRLLYQFNRLASANYTPFGQLVIKGQEADQLDLFKDYKAIFQSVLISSIAQEIRKVLGSSKISNELYRLKALKKTLENIEEMHENPFKFFQAKDTESLLVHPSFVDNSNIKKYLTYLALVVSLILLLAMSTKLLPLEKAAEFAMHITMYITFGLSAIGFADQLHTHCLKQKAQRFATDDNMQFYTAKVQKLQTFFACVMHDNEGSNHSPISSLRSRRHN